MVTESTTEMGDTEMKCTSRRASGRALTSTEVEYKQKVTAEASEMRKLETKNTASLAKKIIEEFVKNVKQDTVLKDNKDFNTESFSAAEPTGVTVTSAAATDPPKKDSPAPATTSSASSVVGAVAAVVAFGVALV